MQLTLCIALTACGGTGVHDDAGSDSSSSAASSSSSGGASAGEAATGSTNTTSSTSSSGQGGVSSAAQTVTGTTTTGCTVSSGITTCTGAQVGSGPLEGVTCEEEGNFCEGSYVVGDLRYCSLQSFSVQCCNGVWTSAYRLEDGTLPECTFSETPRQPGSPFTCGAGDGAETCYVGQSSCGDTHSAEGTQTVACWQLCADADCSCYCDPDSDGNCSYAPSGAQSDEDRCDCTDDRDAITVVCSYYAPTIPSECERDPEFDTSCPNPDTRATAYACTATDDAPDPAPTLSCDVVQNEDATTWYCCAEE